MRRLAHGSAHLPWIAPQCTPARSLHSKPYMVHMLLPDLQVDLLGVCKRQVQTACKVVTNQLELLLEDGHKLQTAALAERPSPLKQTARKSQGAARWGPLMERPWVQEVHRACHEGLPRSAGAGLPGTAECSAANFDMQNRCPDAQLLKRSAQLSHLGR